MRRGLAWSCVVWWWAGLCGCVLMFDGEAALDAPGTENGEAPVATILQGPETMARGRSAIFELACEPADCALECARDEGEYDTCESPYIWEDVSEGEHRLRVRARAQAHVGADVWWDFEARPGVGLVVTGELSVDRFYRNVGSLEIACEEAECVLECGLWQLGEGCDEAQCATKMYLDCSQSPVEVEVMELGRYLLEVEACRRDGTLCEVEERRFKVEAPKWAMVSAGGRHSCGILQNQHLYCWGANDSGQLGEAGVTEARAPLRIDGRWSWVSAGEAHSCGIDEKGRLYCWGGNELNQAAPGEGEWVGVTRLGMRSDWERVEVGAEHSCGVRVGKLYCWGSGAAGQVGPASSYSEGMMVEINAASGSWSGELAVGPTHTCAGAADSVWCFGDTTHGAVGHTLEEATFGEALEVSGAQGLTRLVAGERYSCGRDSTGEVYCWGEDVREDPEGAVISLAATPIAETAAIAVLSGGAEHICGIDTEGGLWCWGENTWRQISSDAGEGRSEVVQVASTRSWSQVSAGGEHSCAIERESRKLYCWGRSRDGRLGSEMTGAAVGQPRAVAWEY
ncbi:hypothetical protein DL240_06760 [Lujinxingia litoralis]|uniref:Chromosome condensation regulator RCC1 n=1 Tax=Lujinxingia litoralis TaxID=2211119 RepID=A0A328CA91_9DELT|nr:RCC1 domain-containing protein [Lujinxingia litoralis]RAL23848.1 hypothetical protein DL240_06760 [Lujinxingia litoralis]